MSSEGLLTEVGIPPPEQPRRGYNTLASWLRHYNGELRVADLIPEIVQYLEETGQRVRYGEEEEPIIGFSDTQEFYFGVVLMNHDHYASLRRQRQPIPQASPSPPLHSEGGDQTIGSPTTEQWMPGLDSSACQEDG